MISLHTFKSFSAIETLCLECEWADLHTWMEPEQLAWLTCKLKHVEDSETVFPHGKWTTIQYLEGLLNDYAKLEVSECVETLLLEKKK